MDGKTRFAGGEDEDLGCKGVCSLLNYSMGEFSEISSRRWASAQGRERLCFVENVVFRRRGT